MIAAFSQLEERRISAGRMAQPLAQPWVSVLKVKIMNFFLVFPPLGLWASAVQLPKKLEEKKGGPFPARLACVSGC